jgi:predicted signal transduction protein with EAL and GGDEF domain
MSASRQTGERQGRGAWARRHNHALVSLARRVWHDDCTLQGALGVICETAAETLEVDRVNVWCIGADAGTLECVHHYQRSTGVHDESPGTVLHVSPGYAALLDEVRVVDYAGAAHFDIDGELSGYLREHGIGSMLDAPVRIAGELIGVVCHEHVGAVRAWSPEDHAFAGSIGDYVAMAWEIDRRRGLEGRVRYLELHDPHTDLPNRDHLLEVVHAALKPMHGDDTGLVAIHLHIDASPHEGDADHGLLARVAGCLRGELGETATLARVRGDAFAVLPHRHLHETEALNLAERCIELIEQGLSEQGTQTVVSAGIAFSRDLSAPSADNLLRNAETASRRARHGRHNRCEVFDAEHHRGLLARLKIERGLREAFAEGRIRLQFQPEVRIDDGRWLAAEALLRWIDGDGEMRPACQFVDIAEASGLIVPLGRWALAEACREARRWPQGNGSAPKLRVNISARQFEQAGLVEDVAGALAGSGLQPGRLCLELTETALLPDIGVAAQTLARLRELGVCIALDDFGVGYSSLAYLRRLPIDVIKLDRSFVAGLPHDPYDLAIVQAVVGLAVKVDIEVVAEGVETEAQAEALRSCGIERAQGFLYARPCDADVLLRGFEARGG